MPVGVELEINPTGGWQKTSRKPANTLVIQ